MIFGGVMAGGPDGAGAVGQGGPDGQEGGDGQGPDQGIRGS